MKKSGAFSVSVSGRIRRARGAGGGGGGGGDEEENDFGANWAGGVTECGLNNVVIIEWDIKRSADMQPVSNKTFMPPPRIAVGACQDTANNVWRLRVVAMVGTIEVELHNGGYRNPMTNPPKTQAEAIDAIQTLKSYYDNGGAGAWHTPEASKDHEEHHVEEFKETISHYWPATEEALEKITLPLDQANSQENALMRMLLFKGGNTIIGGYNDVIKAYKATLGDAARDRPYAAGQLTMNQAIKAIQADAQRKGWTVPQGVDTPVALPRCYQPWLEFNPS